MPFDVSIKDGKFAHPPGIDQGSWYWREECCPACGKEWFSTDLHVSIQFETPLYGGVTDLKSTHWCANCRLSEHGYCHNCGDCGVQFYSWDKDQYLCKDHGGEW